MVRRFHSNTRCLVAVLAAAALLAAALACAATGKGDPAGPAEDPDVLAADAMLGASWDKAPEQREALIARASAAAPLRADLIWLHLQICHRVEGCDSKPIEAQLQKLDPGNAAAWIGELERSSELGDPVRVQAALTAMAGAQRFDIYWNSTVVHLTQAIARAQNSDLATALVMSIGVAAAEANPAYQQIAGACRGGVLEAAELISACRRVAAVLRKGDTYLTEMIGIAIARRVWPEGSPEYRDALEARRIARYRMDTYTRMTSGKERDNETAQRHLQALASHHTEQEVFVAEIVRAGLDPNPGKDWRDSLGEQ